jgi:hypothetical protein
MNAHAVSALPSTQRETDIITQSKGLGKTRATPNPPNQAPDEVSLSEAGKAQGAAAAAKATPNPPQSPRASGRG